MSQPDPLPIYVDLDGTLIHTDLLAESAVQFIARHPLQAPRLVLWLLRGKAHLKAELARRIDLNVASLPYNLPLITHLQALAAQGTPVYLATAANQKYAAAVAAEFGFFSGVLSSDDLNNLTGPRKLKAIQKASGGRFIYAGNERPDLPIWRAASGAIVVNASQTVQRRIRAANLPVVATFDRPARPAMTLLRALRPHQWLKNLLVFLPILPIAGNADVSSMLLQALWAFVAFSLCASAVYVFNDLADLEPDRLHARKRKRPFAGGLLPLQFGVVAAPALLAASALVAHGLGPPFMLVLGVYFVLSSAYTLGLKRYPLIDVLTLAALYTLRVLAGAAAIQITPSFWILAFSMFLFFSLALVKRYVELDVIRSTGRTAPQGRGYRTDDMPLVQAMGITAGYLAVLVVAFYINSADVIERFDNVAILWLLCPLLMAWVSRVWLKAVRSELDDDPLVFALKDKVSLLITGAALLAVLAALLV